jgi:hypothetical protein
VRSLALVRFLSTSYRLLAITRILSQDHIRHSSRIPAITPSRAALTWKPEEKQPCSTYKPGQNSNVETVTSNCFGSALTLVRLVITNKVYRWLFRLPAGARPDSKGSTWKNMDMLPAPCGYELPAGPRSEPLQSKLSALSTDT